MSNTKFDGRLRPAYELYVATFMFLAALLIGFKSNIFFPVHQEFAPIPALLIGLWGWFRLQKGLKIRKYQKNLLQLPAYTLAPEKIPVSKKKLFIGKGFQWTQRHTQRLIEAREGAQHYLNKSALYYRLRAFEDWHEQSSGLLKVLATPLVAISSSNNPLNPWQPLPDVGGKTELHGVGTEEEKNILMNLSERVGHMLVLGTTRVGKTRFAEILVTQDIHRGDTVIVLDPKGDFELMARMRAEAERSGRLDQFHCFHLGYPEISERYNPIGDFERVTEVAGRATSPLPSSGDAASFREFAWRFTNIVARALIGIGKKPNYEDIAKYVTNIEPLLIEYYEFLLDKEQENWRDKVQKITQDESFHKNLPLSMKGKNLYAIALIDYLKHHRQFDSVADGLRGIFEYDKTYYDKLTANLLPMMEKLTSGTTGELVVPDYDNLEDLRPVLDWMSIIRENGIVYVGLDALSDHFVASAIGSAMFSDLTSIAGKIYKHGTEQGLPIIKGHKNKKPTLSLHLDEFNELLSEDFIPMVNKAGGAGFQVTAYTQTGSDIEAGIGNRAKAGQIRGNFNTLVMLRVKEPETADFLSKQLGKVRVYTKMEQSSSTDNNDPETPVDFTSQSTDRIMEQDTDLISNADLMALPKGQAFALIHGNHLYKLRFPLAGKDKLIRRFNTIETFRQDRLEAYQK